MKKDKILYLSADRGIPFGGTKGASIHIDEFLNTLLKKGYSPIVATSRMATKMTIEPTYPVHTLPSFSNLVFMNDEDEVGEDKHTIKEASDYYRNHSIEQTLNNIYVESGFDILYERYSMFSTGGFMFAQNNDIPFVLEVNAPLVLEATNYRQLNQLPLAKSVEKLLFSKADHVITVSKELKEYVLKVAPNANVTAVPNGVTVENFNIFHKNGSNRKLLTDNENEYLVGFVGSVKQWHGVNHIIDAFKIISDKVDDVKLCIVGGCQEEYYNELKLLCKQHNIESKVVFTGAIPHEDIPRYIDALDVVTAPYPDLKNFYFSPLKIYEYMAAGKPIIASSIGQIIEIIQNQENGILVKPGDAKSLAEAILSIKNDKKLASYISKNAVVEAKQKHSWENRLTEIEMIFEEVKLKKAKIKIKNHADTL